MKYLFKFIGFLIINCMAIFILSSCNDKPSDLAVNILPDTVSVHTISSEDTLLITGKRVYAPHFPIFNTGTVFIGKYMDITAATLLNFAWLPDTLGELKEEQIESVELNLFPQRYSFGDTLSGMQSFDIYQVVRRWTPDSTTYDSLFVSPKDYFSSEKIQSWEGKITLKDTMETIKITLPKKIIIDWLKTELKLDTVTNTMKPKRIPNWGLAFVPTENSKLINRFVASAPNSLSASSMVIKYKNAGTDTISYLNLISGVDVTYLKTSVPDTSAIVIQNGLNYWTSFDFDLTMIPKFAGIHKAQFELTLDPSRSRKGNVPLDSIIEIGYFVNNSKSPKFSYYGAKQENSNIYVFNSLSSVAQYNNLSASKFTVVMMPHAIFNQSRELERLTFYGLEEPDESKRPKLKVIYSINPAYLEPKK